MRDKNGINIEVHDDITYTGKHGRQHYGIVVAIHRIPYGEFVEIEWECGGEDPDVFGEEDMKDVEVVW